MKVRELRRTMQPRLVTCSPHDRVTEASARMAKENIGALMVVDASERLVGIISERDICYALGAHGHHVANFKVCDIMSREVVTCRPEDRVEDAMQRMSENTIRHLPVLEGSRLIGVISLRDILEARLRDVRLEANVLRDYARVRAIA